MFTIIIIKILKIFIIGGYMISFFSVSFAKSGTDNLKPNQILVLPMNINQIAAHVQLIKLIPILEPRYRIVAENRLRFFTRFFYVATATNTQ